VNYPVTKLIKPYLDRVSKPQRYIGGEFNEINKNWEEAKCRFLFGFPDVYEVGMSHLGLQILYECVNRVDGLLMERFFEPWVDMRDIMKENNIPLYGLESGHEAKDYDCIGFTLQHEMCFTTVIDMLSLSNVPLLAKDRNSTDPFIICGGPSASNVEPLADFMDAVVIGEGEELLPKLLLVIGEHKKNNNGEINRPELYKEIAKLQGIYVPSLYDVTYTQCEAGLTPLVKDIKTACGAPEVVKKARLDTMETAVFPSAPMVPYIEVVHDRMMVEVLRGCTRNCRFCQAGMIYRPVRERSAKLLVEQAKALKKNTGHNEISLTSLSSSDHSCIKEVVSTLVSDFGEDKISVSLPSLRANHFSVGLAEEIQKVKKTGFTFAAEAGSQRMRDVINKGVTEVQLLSTISKAVEAGWTNMKLYFMIGLPGETDEDIIAIARLCEKIVYTGTDLMRNLGRRGALTVTASCSNFVPKAHTPFQWCGQCPKSELERKQQLLKKEIKDRRIRYTYHDSFTSCLEAVFARGGRELSEVLLKAWSKGCIFDSWTEQMKPQAWKDAFAELSLDMEKIASRDYDLDSVLPWNCVSYGIRTEFLKHEYDLAKKAVVSGDCRYTGCKNCGVCTKDAGLVICGEAIDQ